MIFGRKKRQTDELADETTEVDGDGAADAAADADPEAEARAKAKEAMEAAEARWQEWDDDFDREDGPFDIEEVDLDADDVKRLDLGTLVVTPFEGMNLQISVNKQQVPQSIVVSDGKSAIEIALFGAPARSTYIPEVRREIIATTARTPQARLTVRRGPFGAEIARAVPVQGKDGNPALQVSRTWLVEGPSWVLRGVVFGQAAVQPEDEDVTCAVTECFANLVVRRGTDPVAAGAVIPFRIPEQPVATSDDESEAVG